jgi:predicted RNA binding protein YcfA (HicA-like mRNA interferase family)
VRWGARTAVFDHKLAAGSTKAILAAMRDMTADGWRDVGQDGSPLNLTHPTKPGKVTVPIHGSRDLKIGTLKSIERLSGVNLTRRS